jgi:hypothetical protein
MREYYENDASSVHKWVGGAKVGFSCLIIGTGAELSWKQ